MAATAEREIKGRRNKQKERRKKKGKRRNGIRRRAEAGRREGVEGRVREDLLLGERISTGSCMSFFHGVEIYGLLKLLPAPKAHLLLTSCTTELHHLAYRPRLPRLHQRVSRACMGRWRFTKSAVSCNDDDDDDDSSSRFCATLAICISPRNYFHQPS